ncbi:MAG: hypothetical protein ACTHJW_12775 [Streptosporangiaceae bacterium]
MDVMSDEVAVRQLFDQLTAGQPDAPPDRHSRISRRVRQHRLAKAAGTVAVVAAAVAVAIGVASSPGTVAPVPAQRVVPAWALPWPDHRDGSVPQRVLDGAVGAWRHFAAAVDGVPLDVTSKAKVIWYVGQKLAKGQVVAVVFEADSSEGRRLVAGWATASEVMHGQRAWKQGLSPWVLYDVAAPKPTSGLFIGLNTHGTSAPPGRNSDNWIVVLAAPSVQGVGWSVSVASSTTPSGEGKTSSATARTGMTPAVRGLAIADTGQIEGPVTVTELEGRNRNTLPHVGLVGVPGSPASQVPQLARAAEIHAPPGFRVAVELAGQGTVRAGVSGRRGHLAILARCYGPGRLRLTFGTDVHELQLGTIRCDNAVHLLTTRVTLRPKDTRSGVEVYGRGMTSFRVVIGTIK